MGRVATDDQARQLRYVLIGLGNWRAPVDAEITTWAVWLLSTTTVAVLGLPVWAQVADLSWLLGLAVAVAVPPAVGAALTALVTRRITADRTPVHHVSAWAGEWRTPRRDDTPRTVVVTPRQDIVLGHPDAVAGHPDVDLGRRDVHYSRGESDGAVEVELGDAGWHA